MDAVRMSMKFQCLELAQKTATSAEDVVKFARDYYVFVTGEPILQVGENKTLTLTIAGQ